MVFEKVVGRFVLVVFVCVFRLFELFFSNLRLSNFEWSLVNCVFMV